MEKSNYKFLVVEDEIHANRSIVERMKKFEHWKCAGAVLSLKEAIKIIDTEKPDLLFLDWEVRGGNTFTLLEHIYTLEDYQPYIIYFTGYQNDKPEIPMEIVNKYSVNKYLVKPIFDNLTQHLSEYLLEAEKKSKSSYNDEFIWIENSFGAKEKINPKNIVFISQCLTNSRKKIITMVDGKTYEIKSNWNKCIKIAEEHRLEYSFPNSRYFMINHSFITKFQKPYIWLSDEYKVEITRDKRKDYF